MDSYNVKFIMKDGSRLESDIDLESLVGLADQLSAKWYTILQSGVNALVIKTDHISSALVTPNKATQ